VESALYNANINLMAYQPFYEHERGEEQIEDCPPKGVVYMIADNRAGYVEEKPEY
jgi:hypothetical protein